MFGYSLVKTEELESLRLQNIKMMQVHRWFAGWRDLDIIWDYITRESYWGGLQQCRKDYAFARDTDEYGQNQKGL